MGEYPQGSLGEQISTVGDQIGSVARVARMNELDRLNLEKQRLQERLAEVEQGIAILKNHPELIKLLEVLSGNRY